jgi:hypothetical protein
MRKEENRQEKQITDEKVQKGEKTDYKQETENM